MIEELNAPDWIKTLRKLMKRSDLSSKLKERVSDSSL